VKKRPLALFASRKDAPVKCVVDFTGAALRDGMDGNCDVVFVHDAAREKKFVDEC